MTAYTNSQIAKSISLWNEYFNTSGQMTDDEFHAMSFEERLAMLNAAYPDEDESEDERYINFFPGDMKSEREISVSEDAAYGMAQDLGDFLDSMLKGCTASISADGVKVALEDGALLGQIMSDYGMDEDALQEVVEELHAAL